LSAASGWWDDEPTLTHTRHRRSCRSWDRIPRNCRRAMRLMLGTGTRGQSRMRST